MGSICSIDLLHKGITHILGVKEQDTATFHHTENGECVGMVQGLTGSWDSGRRNNIHGAIGMSDMPLFTGGRATHAASCVSLCMSHVVVPIGEPVLLGVSLIIIAPHHCPYLFKY